MSIDYWLWDIIHIPYILHYYSTHEYEYVRIARIRVQKQPAEYAFCVFWSVTDSISRISEMGHLILVKFRENLARTMD